MCYNDRVASHHKTGVQGDNSIVGVVSIGIVSFQRESQPPILGIDVLYVPRLQNYLISISTIANRGYEVLFYDGQVLMYPKGSNITSTKVIEPRHGKLFSVMFQPTRALFSSTDSRDLHELWHRRMAHLRHGALRVLREIVTWVPNFNTEHPNMCRGCALGKYTNISFPSNDKRVAYILDLIHSDLCGPMPFVSLCGFEYYVTFIDEFSMKT